MPDTIILNGKELAQELNQTLAETIKNSGVTPLLAVITVGDNPASQVYVRSKRKAAQDVGIQTQEFLGLDRSFAADACWFEVETVHPAGACLWQPRRR